MKVKYLFLLFFMCSLNVIKADVCVECYFNNCRYCWNWEEDFNDGDPTTDFGEDGDEGPGGSDSNVFYWVGVECSPSWESMACCCENSAEPAWIPSLRYECYFGGGFACDDPSLGECEIDASFEPDCEAICEDKEQETCA